MYKNNGFSFLELIICLALFAIITLMAIPGLFSWLDQSRVETSMHQLSTTIQYARFAAISSGETVTLCESADQHSCSGSWSDGYILFIDRNSNHKYESGDEILRVGTGVKDGDKLILRAFPSKHYLQLKPEGYNKQQNGTFTYCPKSTSKVAALSLIVNRSGRLRFQKANKAFC